MLPNSIAQYGEITKATKTEDILQKATKGLSAGFGLAFENPSFASLASVRILLSLWPL